MSSENSDGRVPAVVEHGRAALQQDQPEANLTAANKRSSDEFNQETSAPPVLGLAAAAVQGGFAGISAQDEALLPTGVEPKQLFNLRTSSQIPAGTCLYIQSGDTSDFDGYFIAAAADVVKRSTYDFEYIISVAERRTWAHDEEKDTSKHDYELSKEVMDTAYGLLRHLSPNSSLLRGLLNQRNVMPWRMMFRDKEKYGPLMTDLPPVIIKWDKLSELKDRILAEKVTSIILDMNGSMGYLDGLVQNLGKEGEKVLGAKMKASGLPIIIMAGVQAEVKPVTLSLPGRDPRATTNAIYYPDAVRVLLRLAKEHDVPLLFVTNNTCNQLLKFKDADEVVEKLGLQGLLQRIGQTWYSMPHLQGKCVPFDWVTFSAMLLYGRVPSAIKISPRQLYVGIKDPSVLVLRDTGQPENEVVTANVDGTELWGEVESVVHIELSLMLQLAKYAAACTPSGESAPVPQGEMGTVDASEGV